MPVVFAELVRTYPPDRVSNPADPTVAANGQYILVRRAVYETLGGHQAVASKLLARIFKASGHLICFRHGAGLVRTRMYRSFHAMWDGWTKNLALLFRRPLAFAILAYLSFISRIRQAHFPWKANLMAFIGLPIFVSLLVRSHIHSNVRGELTWKGRKYAQSAPKAVGDSSIRKGDLR